MSRVLLAVEGILPDQKTLNYTLQLCKRLKAELKILQILAPNELNKYLITLGKKAKKALNIFEKSMAAAGMAEGGDLKSAREIEEMLREEMKKQVKEIMPESPEESVTCSVSLAIGKPSDEVLRYVNDHHNVVLTIYDSPVNHLHSDTRKYPREFRKLKKSLPVPIVLVKD